MHIYKNTIQLNYKKTICVIRTGGRRCQALLNGIGDCRDPVGGEFLYDSTPAVKPAKFKCHQQFFLVLETPTKWTNLVAFGVMISTMVCNRCIEK